MDHRIPDKCEDSQPPKVWAIVIRTSTAMQQSGIDKQEREVTEFVTKDLRGKAFPKLFIDEGVSGVAMKRPALNLLVKILRNRPGWIDGVVFSDWSRPTRAGRAVACPMLDKFRSLGVEVQWMTKKADMASQEAREVALDLEMGATFAQAEKRKKERDNMSEAMTKLKEVKRANGEWTGGSPGYGLRIENGVPVRNEGAPEDTIILYIKKLEERGESRRSIARTL